jgi:shikimate kinase / 3-dehydroquinate synthase
MIFIYGPPGCGKSTVGRMIAENLEIPFLDLDDEIERKSGISISEIFVREGEPGFRAQESELLQRIATCEDKVVALGGGALLKLENRSLVEKCGTVFCLQADLQTLLARARTNPGQRPLLTGDLPSNLRDLLDKRQSHYASFSERIDISTRSPQQVACEVQVRLGRFRINGMGPGYNVFSSPGVMDQLGDYLKKVGISGTVVVVSDTNVAPIYAEKLRAALRIGDVNPRYAVIPAGEVNKTLDSVSLLWDAFLEAGLERSSAIIALGGGVVGDLAGFAASAFLRGINWVVLPTTLLAMVDSSLGGKTGFDLPKGKNLVGAFYPPRLVLADPTTLATLPEVELRSGLAEVVKHGVIGDPLLFQNCQKGWKTVQSDWVDVVHRAMAVKVRVIQEDPFEKGQRAALNLGHTIGHAIEKASGYRVKHGEAVAIGMVAEARLAERIGLAEKGLSEMIADTLNGLGLPTEIPSHIEPDLIETAMRVDKKRAGGVVRFALPVRLGEVKVGIEVGDMRYLFSRCVS